jgi:tRNA (guanine37-N1)-methyltransferase
MTGFHVLTLFPDFFSSFCGTSIIKRGLDKGAYTIGVHDIRDFALNRYGQVDDAPYGGGAGMLMRPEPIVECFESLAIPEDGRRVIFFSPKGRRIDHEYIIDLTNLQNIVLICGHYEGVDQRVIDILVDEEVSLGDFVVTGGELPAMTLIDAAARQISGVISSDSLSDESFTDDMLEYRQYTRPPQYRGLDVPEVLLSGNHAKIEQFKRYDSLRETWLRRPDLLEGAALDKESSLLLQQIIESSDRG